MKKVINKPINNWFSLHRSEKIKIVESESPFSSERVKEIVRLSWNNSSDHYNQWDCLSRDEKNDLLESFKLEVKVFEYELKKGIMMNNKQIESKQKQEKIMLSEQQVNILLQILNETNFKGADVETLFYLKCKLLDMQRELKKEETPS